MDEDAAAFLGHGCLELDAEESCSKAQASTSKNPERAYLDTGNGEKLDRWYLDCGATHHMTGVVTSSSPT